MRILFLAKTLNKSSGDGRYSSEIIQRVKKQKGVQVTVVTQEKSNFEFIKPVLFRANSIATIPLNVLRTRKYIKRCNIIHTLDGYPYGVIGALANIGLSKKLIISAVGTYSVAPLEKFLKRNLLKWAYKKASKVLCISKFTQKEVLKRLKLDNTSIINLGVDCSKFQKIRSKKKTNRIILGVGALKTRKGYHISIPAVAMVKKKYSNIKYYIIGDQFDRNYFDELKRLAREHGLEKNLFLKQNVSNKELIELYNQADIFLLTPVNIDNNFEGFGLVYLEANACGLPVIGSYNCGAEDIIKNNYNGLLVPQKDIKNITKAILKLMDNPTLAQELGRNGEKVAKKMNWDRVITQYLKVYNSTLK